MKIVVRLPRIVITRMPQSFFFALPSWCSLNTESLTSWPSRVTACFLDSQNITCCRSDWTTAKLYFRLVSLVIAFPARFSAPIFFETFLTTLSIWAPHVSALSIMNPNTCRMRQSIRECWNIRWQCRLGSYRWQAARTWLSSCLHLGKVLFQPCLQSRGSIGQGRRESWWWFPAAIIMMSSAKSWHCVNPIPPRRFLLQESQGGGAFGPPPL